jgi:hypothetical protein
MERHKHVWNKRRGINFSVILWTKIPTSAEPSGPTKQP